MKVCCVNHVHIFQLRQHISMVSSLNNLEIFDSKAFKKTLGDSHDAFEDVTSPAGTVNAFHYVFCHHLDSAVPQLG